MYACTSCGAVVEIDPQRVATQCIYCTAPLVDSTRAASAVDAVVPFRLTKRAAAERLRAYISDRWWTPEPLRKLARQGQMQTEHVRGVLVPHYAYDASIRADYSARIGVHWEREKKVKRRRSESLSPGEIPSLNEDNETETVRETEWFDLRGHMATQLDDHLVCASTGLTHARDLEPFDLGQASPFESRLLLGWDAELPSLSRRDIDREAHRTLSEVARDHLEDHHLTGDEQELRTVELDVQIHRVRLVLLPVWMMTARLGDTLVQVAINGQTGTCAGSLPTSMRKVALTIVALAALILTILWLRGDLPWT